MPHTLHLSKSTISPWSIQIGQKIAFSLSSLFIKLWKQQSILIIIFLDLEGNHEEYEWLRNKNYKAKNTKGKGKQHWFYNFNSNKCEHTSLPELFPDLFYKQWLSLPLNLPFHFLTPLILPFPIHTRTIPL